MIVGLPGFGVESLGGVTSGLGRYGVGSLRGAGAVLASGEPRQTGGSKIGSSSRLAPG